jgi:hypothetical protein
MAATTFFCGLSVVSVITAINVGYGWARRRGKDEPEYSHISFGLDAFIGFTMGKYVEWAAPELTVEQALIATAAAGIGVLIALVRRHLLLIDSISTAAKN